MESFIEIEPIWYSKEENLYEFKLIASNGETLSQIKFYQYSDFFKKFAQNLTVLPSIGLIDEIEIGNDQKKEMAYYLKISVSCISLSGQISINIILDNYLEAPLKTRAEFSISTNIINLNELGKRLNIWEPSLNNIFKFKF